MSRIKGWVIKKTIHSFCRNGHSMVYMEEIPKNAIRGEEIVHDSAGIGWLVMPDMPANLIGKKVSFIIIPEEN